MRAFPPDRRGTLEEHLATYLPAHGLFRDHDGNSLRIVDPLLLPTQIPKNSGHFGFTKTRKNLDSFSNLFPVLIEKRFATLSHRL